MQGRLCGRHATAGQVEWMPESGGVEIEAFRVLSQVAVLSFQSTALKGRLAQEDLSSRTLPGSLLRS
jgi:hypothetical protein